MKIEKSIFRDFTVLWLFVLQQKLIAIPQSFTKKLKGTQSFFRLIDIKS
jgi:hypothetical protein